MYRYCNVLTVYVLNLCDASDCFCRNGGRPDPNSPKMFPLQQEPDSSLSGVNSFITWRIRIAVECLGSGKTRRVKDE
jgi:hypothetical protein